MPRSPYPTSADLAAFRQAIAQDWHADASRHAGPGSERYYIAQAMRPTTGAQYHELPHPEAAPWAGGIGSPDRGLVNLPEPDGGPLPDGTGGPFGVGAVSLVQARAGAWWAWLTRAAAADRAHRYDAEAMHGHRVTLSDIHAFEPRPVYAAAIAQDEARS